MILLLLILHHVRGDEGFVEKYECDGYDNSDFTGFKFFPFLKNKYWITCSGKKLFDDYSGAVEHLKLAYFL